MTIGKTVVEERMPGTQPTGHSAAEVARQKNRSERRRPRDCVDSHTDELDDPEAHGRGREDSRAQRTRPRRDPLSLDG